MNDEQQAQYRLSSMQGAWENASSAAHEQDHKAGSCAQNRDVQGYGAGRVQLLGNGSIPWLQVQAEHQHTSRQIKVTMNKKLYRVGTPIRISGLVKWPVCKGDHVIKWVVGEDEAAFWVNELNAALAQGIVAATEGGSASSQTEPANSPVGSADAPK